MVESNPYQAPTILGIEGEAPPTALGLDYLAVCGWPLVFLANLAIPTLVGWDIVFGDALAGCAVAIVAQLLAGWSLCFLAPSLARRLMLGAIITAISQFVPILQLFAGLAGFIVADIAGVIENNRDMGPGELHLFVAGFLVTFITGGLLLVCAGAGGLLVSFFLPGHWFTRRSSDPNSPGYQPR